MEKDKWPYTLDLYYREKHDNGLPAVRMYFDNIGRTFENLLLQYPAQFTELTKPGTNNSAINNAIINGPDGILVEAKIGSLQGGRDGLYENGLYYHFPKGIKAFEKMAGHDLSDFKGYNSKLEYRLVSYWVNEEKHPFKNSTAYDKRLELLEPKKTENDFRVELVTNYFGTNSERNRQINPHTYAQTFYTLNYDQAINKLLSIDFNKISENIAWDKDLEGFYSHLSVNNRHGEVASIVVRDHKDKKIPRTDIDFEIEGVYLKLGMTSDLTLFLDNLVKSLRDTSKYLVATYNNSRTGIDSEETVKFWQEDAQSSKMELNNTAGRITKKKKVRIAPSNKPKDRSR